MKTCSNGHLTINFDDIECPVCALIREICKLEKKVGTLENTVDELKETVEMYADNQRNSKRGF